MKDIKSTFEELKTYQKALDFIDETYQVTKSFPKNETYGLTSQYKRASLSIALNIAEGSGDTNKQFNEFLNISSGSIKECVVCYTVANRLDYITAEQNHQAWLKLQEFSKMTSGHKNYLNNSNNQRPTTKD